MNQQDQSNYYVYSYLREDGTPYYIGKGKLKRAWVKHRGEVHPPNDHSRIQIIESNLYEDQAFKLEKELIKRYGRKDNNTGILRNKTDGGEGSSGHLKTQEWIDDHSSFMKNHMKGALSPMHGKKQTTEHVNKRMKAHVGAKRSAETCDKISTAATGRVQSQEIISKRILYVSCCHCGSEVDKGNHKRWHGDKCKMRDKS